MLHDSFDFENTENRFKILNQRKLITSSNIQKNRKYKNKNKMAEIKVSS